ncbi:Regulatory protein alcR [Penicillium cataractarum]|uniref:Regulatory protein alcR n=1 Tax=Penicillium cataractarum TaxID=2100454 RepID=A0A9W9RY22_9EURO|nr:Regulatory protein alcR [Penicillium cataractarum]KAJ5368301.1 Regulatory protein alcR [Penicillium cataractarum]
METSRRSQHHSCDPCRKGKRGCDAPKNRKETGFSSCSNCKKWKKECTFNFLSSKRVEAKRDHRKAKATTAATAIASPQSRELPSNFNSHGDTLDDLLLSSQWYPVNSEGMVTPASTTNRTSFSPPSLNLGGSIIEDIGSQSYGNDQFEFPSWNINAPEDFWFPVMSTQDFEKPFSELSPKSLENAFDGIPHFEENSLGMSTLDSSALNIIVPGYRDNTRQYPSYQLNKRQKSKFECHFCIVSNNTAAEYARSTMTQNLIRIYHDSLENALSCWLTEHNCPYSDPLTDVLPYKERKEWGANWPNRMCIRVCRLDRASSGVRGRSLSADEDKAAARALHLSIIAFASQWTQHAQKGSNMNVPPEIARDERSIRENVWNQARHALEHTTGIPSFRIIFANIIFSLTQCPLDDDEDERLGQLLENDIAPMFLEHANRQLFTFRHKLIRLQREAPSNARELRRGSIGSTLTDMSEIPKFSNSAAADPTLTNDEYRTTLSLLFWLGVMFDTLSAAMYQRPLVVSDEDSQITSTTTPASDFEDQVDLNGWNVPRNEIQKKQDVWGDFFLRQASSQEQARWPCSYEEAASVLSEATPVKVLLYRRVTQLQTLVYRGVGPKRLEEVIKETLLVYHHWNNTYQRFMLDCVANHELLPPRLQSWYVILDGHWHLAAMLLADVLETVDRGRLGLDVERESRHSTNLITKLRRENAFAVGALARSSLRGKESIVRGDFHDSLTEVAFLTEPWTVVLIHSFAKAGYISLEGLDTSVKQDSLFECFRQNCEFCISALQYLGRKSDMAMLVARDLTRNLNVKYNQRLVVV